MKNRLVVLLIIGLGLTLGSTAFSPRVVAQDPPPRATVTPTNSANVPPRPTLTTTPRPTEQPTAVPTAAPTAAGSASRDAAEGSRAQIILVAGQSDGRWAVVQWLDGLGEWQDVEGWQGHIRQSQIRWRVLPKDFGNGPYRWVVYDKPDGQRLCTSKPFHLPTDALATVSVAVYRCALPAAPDNGDPAHAAPAPGGLAQGERLYVLRVRYRADGSPYFTIHNIDTFETWDFSSFENLQNFLTTDGTTPTQP